MLKGRKDRSGVRPELALTVLAAAVLLAGREASRRSERAAAAPEGTMAVAALVINEVDYDQPGADTEEFVEIYNDGADAVDLDDVFVLGVNGDGTVYRREALPGVTLGAGDYFVVGSADVHNLDHDVGATSWIQNGAPDAVALVWNPTTNPDNDQIIDTVSYEGAVPGGPLWGGTWTEGSVGAPADDGGDDFIGLSRYPDGEDSDDNDADFAAYCVTPGEANTNAVGGCPDPETGGGTHTPTPGPATATPTPSPTAGGPTATPTSPPATATPTAAPSATPTVGPSATPTDIPDVGELAVELARFEATREGRTVRLRWETLSETDHAGFRLLRVPAGALAPRGSATAPLPDRLPGALYVGPAFPPRGDAFEGARYEATDPRAPRAALDYWLVDLDTHGRATWHGPRRVAAMAASADLPGLPGGPGGAVESGVRSDPGETLR